MAVDCVYKPWVATPFGMNTLPVSRHKHKLSREGHGSALSRGRLHEPQQEEPMHTRAAEGEEEEEEIRMHLAEVWEELQRLLLAKKFYDNKLLALRADSI